jgi:ribosome-associated heat shock protein Hsp15
MSEKQNDRPKGESMRLDLYLKRCCITKQRSEAKRACDNGIVEVDGHAARASRLVRTGQHVSIAFLDRYLEVEVVRIPLRNVSKSDAKTYYEILRDETREITDF